MIVIGYQGIGKSTLAKRSDRYIDLESGSFWIDGKRSDDWYKAYCNVAEHLSKQGYIVCVSSHEVVRKRLESSTEDMCLVYPALELKDQWIAKLQARYDQSGLEKDYKALVNAVGQYDTNIEALESSNIDQRIVLNTMSYDLEAALIHHINAAADVRSDFMENQ